MSLHIFFLLWEIQIEIFILKLSPFLRFPKKMSVFRKLNKSKLHLLQRICLPSANKASQEKNVRIFLILVFIYEKCEKMGVSILRKTLLE